MNKTKVRTTFNPGEVIEVGDAELTDLRRQGLIVADEQPTETTEANDAEADTPEADIAPDGTIGTAPAETATKKGARK